MNTRIDTSSKTGGDETPLTGAIVCHSHDGLGALIAAVGRELDGPVVSADGDLVHEEAKKAIDVTEP